MKNLARRISILAKYLWPLITFILGAMKIALNSSTTFKTNKIKNSLKQPRRLKVNQVFQMAKMKIK